MYYLRTKSKTGNTRKDGSQIVEALLVTKPRKYAKATSEKNLSVKSPVLIVGAHDAGKSRTLIRLYDNAYGIWGAKIKSEPVMLSQVRPIASWAEHDFIAKWYNANAIKLHGDSDTRLKLWVNLKQWERVDQLGKYIADTGCIVFLDDCHKLSGRKLAIARECVMSAKIYVATASQENRIAPNLRSVMLRRDPQLIRLGSPVAYDATNIIMWFFITAFAMAGMWEFAVVLGGLKLVGSGKRAARQE